MVLGCYQLKDGADCDGKSGLLKSCCGFESRPLGSAIYTLQRVLQNPLEKIHEIPTQDDRIINNASIRETR